MSLPTVKETRELLPAITQDEDTFCMALLEYGGNLAAAYRATYGAEASNAIARARMLIGRPEIAKRINELNALVNEHAMISVGSHLQELAEIRDLGKATGQLKVALTAEKYRGDVMGMYKKNDADQSERAPTVVINMGTATPVSVHEWSDRQGVSPMIIAQ